MTPIQKRKYVKVIPPPVHLINSQYGNTFLNYANVLNRANETREALVTQARAITKHSKDVISHLHRIDLTNQESVASNLNQARRIISEIHVEIYELTPLLSDNALRSPSTLPGGSMPEIGLNETKIACIDNYHRFSNSFTFCLEEYVEAFSLYYFLQFNELLSLETIDKEMKLDIGAHLQSASTQQKLVNPSYDIHESIQKRQKLSNTESFENRDTKYPILPITLSVYLLGIFDLMGELMRLSMNSTISQKQIMNLVRFSKILFLHLNDTCLGRKHLGINQVNLTRKIQAAKTSLEKVEKVAYKWDIRVAEFPHLTESQIREIMLFKANTENKSGETEDVENS